MLDFSNIFQFFILICQRVPEKLDDLRASLMLCDVDILFDNILILSCPLMFCIVVWCMGLVLWVKVCISFFPLFYHFYFLVIAVSVIGIEDERRQLVFLQPGVQVGR